MRPILTLLHRWIGLATAAFLFLAGATGAVISWDHELDDWLNPHLTTARTTGPARPSLELAAEAEARDPRAWVTYVPLAPEPGESLALFVEPRVNPETGRLYDLGYNQIFLDPATSTELGRREWGRAWPITTETLVSFLYKLHYTLHIPTLWGTDRIGYWLMGAIALLWTVDCFIGLALTLPRRQTPNRPGPNHSGPATPPRGFLARWAPAWRIKRGASPYRLNLDIHRAFSLWTWALLLVLAFTGVSLNLYRELFYPLMSTVSTVTPPPFDTRPLSPPDAPITPAIPMTEALALGRAEATRRGWTTPPGAVFYAARYGLYNVRFFAPGDDHGAAGVGPAELYLDSTDGRVLGQRQPWKGTAADIFVQAQFPLHSGRILGLPGRIAISIMGVITAILSATGVIIWWKKRAARLSAHRKRTTPAAEPDRPRHLPA
ncbi:PepSY-associated TM helix domain-containing protein [Muricoccus aerilatus]|uniref:PepSY-associated TM helix domain-containing protein n=1 Tax=Muricoccus aerilatus TaxID=452982 RepID=UPI0006937386|nr:PepSY-associated TM helix domain-containing protein [Roseomonas aerilata]